MSSSHAQTVRVCLLFRSAGLAGAARLITLLWVLTLVRASAFGANETFPHREYRDIVAVSVGDRQIVVATLADLERFRLRMSKSLGDPQWRFRRVPIPTEFDNPNVTLAASGTKILFTESDKYQLLDISRRVSEQDVASHRLPDEVFALPKFETNPVRILEDGTLPYTPRGLRDAERVYVHVNGSAVVVDREAGLRYSPSWKELGDVGDADARCRNEQFTELEVLTGYDGMHSAGSEFDFIVVGGIDGAEFGLFDPVSPDCPRLRPESMSLEQGRIAARLLLGHRDVLTTCDDGDSCLLDFVEQYLESLEAAADADRMPPVEWHFFWVYPNFNLYVPVLQFAYEERVFPTRVDIWKELVAELEAELGSSEWRYRIQNLRADDLEDDMLFREPGETTFHRARKVVEQRESHGKFVSVRAERFADAAPAQYRFRSNVKLETLDLEEELYRIFTNWPVDERKNRCAIYTDEPESYNGSFILNYWIYYPFDDGGVGPHQHDPEHVFVEIDKLGGTVRGIYASAHSTFTANNIFQNLASAASEGSDERARPVELPIYTITELAKHATAPDVNRDGVFTPGLDENYYMETAKLWGVRDAFGNTDQLYLRYNATMAAPRRSENRLMQSEFARYFQTDTLVSSVVPDRRHVCELLPLAKAAVEPEAVGSLGSLGDVLSREALAEMLDHPDEGSPMIFKPGLFPIISARAGWQHTRFWTFGVAGDIRRFVKIPLPGRLAFQFGSEFDKGFEQWNFLLQYEKFLSNHFGYYAGYRGTWLRSEEDADRYRNGIGLGLMIEVARQEYGFNFQPGFIWHTGMPLEFEFRAQVTIPLYRSHFGIAENAPDPYGDSRR